MSGWSNSGSGFALAPSVAGEPAWRVELEGLPRLVDPADGFALRIAEVAWRREDGVEGRAAPQPRGAFLQPPAATAPCAIDEALGLELTVRFIPEPEGILGEFRLQTTAGLEYVTLRVESRVPGLVGCVLPLAGDVGVEPDQDWPAANHGVVRLQASTSRHVAVDLGEWGRVATPPGAPGPRWRFFRQPLEKGVILVGRIAIWTRPPPAAIEDAYRNWRRRRSYL